MKTDLWQRLCDTWNAGSPEACAKALGGLLVLFRETSKDAAERFGYSYPDYDEKVSPYLGKLIGRFLKVSVSNVRKTRYR